MEVGGGLPAFTKMMQAVFSKARVMMAAWMKRCSDNGFHLRPAGGQSSRVQRVGIIIVLAPEAISSRKASGKARSQQMRSPTRPIGVSNATCGEWEEEVR